MLIAKSAFEIYTFQLVRASISILYLLYKTIYVVINMLINDIRRGTSQGILLTHTAILHSKITLVVYCGKKLFSDLQLFSVDGGFTPWSAWSQCSVNCGKGLQNRARSCINPKPRCGGKACDSTALIKEEKICQGKCLSE